jgi:hypothetical protein
MRMIVKSECIIATLVAAAVLVIVAAPLWLFLLAAIVICIAVELLSVKAKPHLKESPND